MTAMLMTVMLMTAMLMTAMLMTAMLIVALPNPILLSKSPLLGDVPAAACVYVASGA